MRVLAHSIAKEIRRDTKSSSKNRNKNKRKNKDKNEKIQCSRTSVYTLQNKFKHENHVYRTFFFFLSVSFSRSLCFSHSASIYSSSAFRWHTENWMNAVYWVCLRLYFTNILVFVRSFFHSSIRRVLECKLVTTFSCVINYASVLLGWMPSTTNTNDVQTKNK